VLIIRRNNRIYAILGICHSVWMTLWSAGWNEINILRKIMHQVGFIYKLNLEIVFPKVAI